MQLQQNKTTNKSRMAGFSVKFVLQLFRIVLVLGLVGKYEGI